MTVDANSQPGLLGPSPSTQAVEFRSGHLCAIDATLPARRATVDATTLRKNARATAVDTKLPRVAGSGLASGIQMPARGRRRHHSPEERSGRSRRRDTSSSGWLRPHAPDAGRCSGDDACRRYSTTRLARAEAVDASLRHVSLRSSLCHRRNIKDRSLCITQRRRIRLSARPIPMRQPIPVMQPKTVKNSVSNRQHHTATAKGFRRTRLRGMLQRRPGRARSLNHVTMSLSFRYSKSLCHGTSLEKKTDVLNSKSTQLPKGSPPGRRASTHISKSLTSRY